MKLSKWSPFLHVRKESQQEKQNRTECDKIKEQRKREQRKAYNLARFNKQGKKGRWR